MIKQLYTILLALLLCNCAEVNFNPGNPNPNPQKPTETRLPRNVASVLLNNISMRDPYITLAEDSCYYLTYTDNANFAEEKLRVWKSENLVDWKELNCNYRLNQVPNYQTIKDKATANNDIPKIWAPEIYNFNGKWYLTHTTNQQTAIFAISDSINFENFDTPFGSDFGHRHDPMIFTDTDKSHWLVWACMAIQKFNPTLTAFEGNEIGNIKTKNKVAMGHEGCQIIKIKDKYVWFGTGWSNSFRVGSYNLYYATSDSIASGYSERRLAGHCLGHGTIFQDKTGEWWCTAFANGTIIDSVPENPTKSYTINKKGLNLIPMNIRYINGDVKVNALDPRYAIDNTK